MWKPQVLATASGRFAYASTLAIYIFETTSFQLQKVLAHGESNISAIEWDPKEALLAHATQDRKLIIWDLETESIKFNVTLPSVVNYIEWSGCGDGLILLLLANCKTILNEICFQLRSNFSISQPRGLST